MRKPSKEYLSAVEEVEFENLPEKFISMINHKLHYTLMDSQEILSCRKVTMDDGEIIYKVFIEQHTTMNAFLTVVSYIPYENVEEGEDDHCTWEDSMWFDDFLHLAVKSRALPTAGTEVKEAVDEMVSPDPRC